MELNDLTAISPIDGRYRSKVKELAPYFSEFGLIKYRVLVEIEYFIALCEIPLPELKTVDPAVFPRLRTINEIFSLEDAQRVKDIEKTTNHDVKAVEYFVKEQFERLGLSGFKEFVHFGLTSQDITNTAIPLMTKHALDEIILPALVDMGNKLVEYKTIWRDIAMLAHTHGQPASPTRLGKEIGVFVERLENQGALLKTIQYKAKFGGATGNFNAHYVAYPEINWKEFSDNFISSLGLVRQQTTTQIEHYDNLAALFDNWKRINTILIDLTRDMWTYVSMNYFKQKIKQSEVGSSAMPHKVNPIDFENAEGNLGMANTLFEHLSAKLPISRLQRDLTDSTVTRNIGVPFAHTLIALNSTLKGLNKLELHKESIDADLVENWVVVSEAIQTVLRREGYPQPYEALKELTRTNKLITEEIMNQFIDGLNITDELKVRLKNITPFTYTGI